MKKVAIDARTLLGCTGASAIVLEHARFLVHHGFKVDIFSEKTVPELVRSVGAASVMVKSFGLSDYQRRRSFANRVQKMLEQGGYDLVVGNGGLLKQDVVFLHNLVHRAHELIPGASDKKVKTVGRIHADFLGQARFRLLIANSNMMKNDLINRFKIPDNKIITVYPGNDLTRFSLKKRCEAREKSRRDLGVGNGETLVGLITSGDFVNRGVEEFFTAVNRLADPLLDSMKLLVVGKEKNFSSYRAILKQSARDKVIYISQEKEVEKLFFALDLYVLPAYIETFGLVIQEAMACGLPIITTRNVGASEILPPEQSHYILDDVDPRALAERILTLAEDKALRERLGAANARAAETNNWTRYNEQIFTVYKGIGLI